MKRLIGIALVLLVWSAGTGAQDAAGVVAAASKAMGADGLTSITYAGTANDINFQGRGRNGELAGEAGRSVQQVGCGRFGSVV